MVSCSVRESSEWVSFKTMGDPGFDLHLRRHNVHNWVMRAGLLIRVRGAKVKRGPGAAITRGRV